MDTQRPFFQRFRLSSDLWAGLITLCLLLPILIFSNQLTLIALVPVMVFALLVIMRSPTLMVVAFLAVAIWPVLLIQTPGFNPDYGAVGGGFIASDLVLLLMAAQIGLQLLLSHRLRARVSSWQGIFIGLFGLWLAYEIIRNVDQYGLSAPGEFRFRYLILVVPIYIATSFRSQAIRLRLLRLLIFSAVVLPLLVLPLVGTLKGWSVGPENRFFNAQTSLGMVYGLIALFIAKKYRLIRVSSTFMWLGTVPVLALVLVDSHRSVWLASLIALGVLVWFKQIKLRLITRYLPILLLLALIVLGIATTSGLDVGDYIATRAGEVLNPGATPGTVTWRLNQWAVELQAFTNSPLAGDGFGGYWITGIQPHNYYVQTLAKLGIVGLGLYVLNIIGVFRALRCWRKIHISPSEPEMALVITGLVALVAGHAFYVAYSLEAYTWLFVGLGAAVVVNWKHA
jgi:O-antigen ligase